MPPQCGVDTASSLPAVASAFVFRLCPAAASVRRGRERLPAVASAFVFRLCPAAESVRRGRERPVAKLDLLSAQHGIATEVSEKARCVCVCVALVAELARNSTESCSFKLNSMD